MDGLERSPVIRGGGVIDWEMAPNLGYVGPVNEDIAAEVDTRFSGSFVCIPEYAGEGHMLFNQVKNSLATGECNEWDFIYD